MTLCDCVCKVFVLGPTKSGKTTLLDALDNASFSDHGRTVGIQNRCLNHKGVSSIVFDFAGEHKNRSLQSLYLSGDALVLLVFDATMLTSEEYIKELKYLMDEIWIHRENKRVLMVATHKDKLDEAILHKFIDIVGTDVKLMIQIAEKVVGCNLFMDTINALEDSLNTESVQEIAANAEKLANAVMIDRVDKDLLTPMTEAYMRVKRACEGYVSGPAFVTDQIRKNFGDHPTYGIAYIATLKQNCFYVDARDKSDEFVGRLRDDIAFYAKKQLGVRPTPSHILLYEDLKERLSTKRYLTTSEIGDGEAVDFFVKAGLFVVAPLGFKGEPALFLPGWIFPRVSRLLRPLPDDRKRSALGSDRWANWVCNGLLSPKITQFMLSQHIFVCDKDEVEIVLSVAQGLHLMTTLLDGKYVIPAMADEIVEDLPRMADYEVKVRVEPLPSQKQSFFPSFFSFSPPQLSELLYRAITHKVSNDSSHSENNNQSALFSSPDSSSMMRVEVEATGVIHIEAVAPDTEKAAFFVDDFLSILRSAASGTMTFQCIDEE